jgi:hypothetical protein
MQRSAVCRRLLRFPFNGASLDPSRVTLQSALFTQNRCVSSFKPTSLCHLPLKPGTPIPGLDIYKEKEPPVALERSEYPDWLESLTKPLPSLATLRRMPEEEASDRDKMRYLKLTRRMKIKQNNEETKGKKR